VIRLISSYGAWVCLAVDEKLGDLEKTCEISVTILHNIPEIYLPFLAANGREAPPSKIHTVCVYIWRILQGRVCVYRRPSL
jgi:hypothetical protein